MPASSPPMEVTDSKPLNPSALSFEPHCSKSKLHPYHHQFLFKSLQLYQASLLLFHEPEPVMFPGPSFIYSNPWSLYDPAMQPRPWCNGFNGPNFVPYKEKKMKSRVLLPPRLRRPRDNLMVWERNEDAMNIKAGSDVNCDGVTLVPPVTAEELKKFDGKTSLMIRNIPNHFKFGLNLGYAFVNFTTHVAALRFYRVFNNLKWSCGNIRKKICEIGIAKYQGKDTLKNNFQHSSFLCHTMSTCQWCFLLHVMGSIARGQAKLADESMQVLQLPSMKGS
ncbi:MEI2 C-terminal RRM only like 1 protein [Hibiscus syriacus]|uniref:MEI2 C-terminal RRM only like 1 protein n=1 Tax=Hibiscus syriacus TaxID=106335 RepID=A0A6A2YX14_HIBSY|nr:MEI2 C-terminal RRM only like 1 protein [Hibiscus syriacus]